MNVTKKWHITSFSEHFALHLPPKEHFDEIRKRKKEINDITREIKDVTIEKG